VAIKGKSRSRSRRVVAIPPRQPVYVRKPPVWRRWWVWAIVGVLVAGGIAAGVLLSLHSKHERDFKAAEASAVTQFGTLVEKQFPPSPDTQPAPPTRVLIYPTLAADLDKVATGKLDGTKKGKSLVKSANASADAIQAIKIFSIIPEDAEASGVPATHGPGATRVTLVDAQWLMTEGFRLYAQVGALMQEVDQATGEEQRALLATAKDLTSRADLVFQRGYQKLVNVRAELGVQGTINFPSQAGSGLGG
jgi:hypothetical protein